MVLVTGASRGIGRATALGLADAGADVAVVARDLARLNEVAAEVERRGRRCAVYALDVCRGEQVVDSVARCGAELGPVDVLVNNAGVAGREPIERLSDEAWQEAISVNLTAAFTYARAVAGSMCERGWGRIVNVASISAQTGGVRGSVAYASSKGGLIALTKTLARDLGPFGVTVNAVAPGQIATRMGTQQGAEQLAELRRQIPIGRLGTPEEVAAAIRFLASPEASYITGATLDVNGGIARR